MMEEWKGYIEETLDGLERVLNTGNAKAMRIEDREIRHPSSRFSFMDSETFSVIRRVKHCHPVNVIFFNYPQFQYPHSLIRSDPTAN